jgi:serine/threonine protein kinase
VSPSNVLLSRAGEVKLTDFGIAKRAESDATHGGAVRGKFAYISPEQARNETLDPRADVFSVGLLMWELICNRRLFSGLDDLSALRAVRDPNIPRPSHVDPKLSPEVDQILMTALAKDKSRRYPSAGVFGQKLRSLRYSLEVTSGDPATELAKIIESTEAVERESAQLITPPGPSGRFDFDGAEATVIRIRTADAFSARDNDASIVKARQVIDRFEEEETRLAQLSGDQLKMLRSRSPRDSNEMTSAAAPLRSRRDSSVGEEEATRMRAPIDVPFEPSNLTPSDQTRLIAPRDRRTPPPQRALHARPGTAPPPMPRGRGPTPGLPGLADAPPLHLEPSSPALPGMPPAIAPAPAMGQLPIPPQPAMPQPAIPQPPPNLGLSGGPALPFQPAPPAAQYPAWGSAIAPQLPQRDATPTSRDSFDRPVFANRPAQPQVAGFGPQKKKALRPWVLVVGAFVMALLAFAITRAFIG